MVQFLKDISRDLRHPGTLGTDEKHHHPHHRTSPIRRLDSRSPFLSINFESALRYVDISIPDDLPLALDESGEPSEEDRFETLTVLRWLRLKDVSRIHALRVRDSRYRPHCDDVIRQLVELYPQVEMLDWQRTDLSIDTIREAAPNIRELYLYATGWASLSHWLGEDGLRTMPRVCNSSIERVKRRGHQILNTVFLQAAQTGD